MLVPRPNAHIKAVDPKFEMGKVLVPSGTQPLYLNERHLSVHSCVLGQSGSGKSKFLELLMRYLMAAGRGFALIDPHGDLSEDLLAYAMHRKVSKNDTQLADRIHYLEPSYEQVFGYDPFRFHPAEPIPPEHVDAAYRSWLDAKVFRVIEVLQRQQGQAGVEGMPRLKRVLTNVLTAVGTAVGKDRRHLPLADALVLLNPSHRRHFDAFNRVAPYLPEDIVAEFRRWHQIKNPDQLFKDTESSINRLRSFLSPIVKAIFCNHVETIDFRSIVQNGEILLVNLRETDYFSADQANAIGGLFIHELLSTAQSTPRAVRKRFYMFVDEAADFIGADIQRALGIMRKFELPVCLAAQDLSSFKKGELDLRPKVLSQCGTIVSFRQTWPEDLDILVQVMGMGNLDFQKHYQIVDRPDGYEFIDTVTYTQNFTWNDNWSNGFSLKESETRSKQETQSSSQSVANGVSNSRQESSGQSGSRGRTVTRHPLGVKSEADQSGVSNSRNSMSGTSDSLTTTSQEGQSIADGISRQLGQDRSQSRGGAEGGGVGVSYGKQALARTREEHHETSNLLNSVADQFWKMKQGFFSLGERQGIAKLLGVNTALAFETCLVDEKWLPEHKFEVIARAKTICSKRPYFSLPDVSNEAEERRLSEYIDTEGDSSSAPDGPRGSGEVFEI